MRQMFFEAAPEQLPCWRYWIEATFCLTISPVIWPLVLCMVPIMIVLFSAGALLVGWYPTRNFFQSCQVWTREDDRPKDDFVRYTTFPPIIVVISAWIVYSLVEFVKVSYKEGLVVTFYKNTAFSGFNAIPNSSVSLPTQFFLTIPSTILVTIGWAIAAGLLIGIMHCAFELDTRFRIFEPWRWFEDKFVRLFDWIFTTIEKLYYRFRKDSASNGESH